MRNRSANHMRLRSLVLMTLMATACDGVFTADGIVVDVSGKPISGARITARDRTVVSNSAGCFHAFLITSPRPHTISFTVQAMGFASTLGDLPSPGALRLRVTPSAASTKLAETVAVNPPVGALGACEPRSALPIAAEPD